MFWTKPSFIVRASLATALCTLAITATAAPGPKTKRRDLSKGNTLYVVGYAHLDTQWRWAYPQVIREFIWNTLTRNFALMDKYPDYVFNFSGSRRYEMMKEYYPDLFQKLKGYVAKGQWFPCGSSVDEGDANVPSAESLVRHVLYGNRFFKKEFGVASHEFMLPDCFGFPYALPSVLTHCGIQGFSTQKLTWGSSVGIPFKVGNWEGPDGTSVVAALDPGSYGSGINEDLTQNTSWLARIQNTGKMSGAYADYHYYGTGDVGGSPSEDSVQWMEKSLQGHGPISVVSSHSEDMYRDLTPEEIAKLPRYKGELLLKEHSAGSISSEAYMKRWNRKNELLADGAEKASVAAMLTSGTPYPAQRLYNAWDLVLGSQMHDMLPGTSIPKAYEFCWNDELLALNQFANVETDAVGAVARQMDIGGAESGFEKNSAFIIFNPLSVARQDVVETAIPAGMAKQMSPSAKVSDGTGTWIAKTPLGEWSAVQELNNGHILVSAKVGPSSLTSCDLRFKANRYPMGGDPVSVKGQSLENSHLRVTIDDNGDISSIFDKKANREVLKAPVRLVLQYHNPKQFPAWNMDWDDAKAPPREIVSGPAKITVVEDGPVRAAIQVERECKGSKFVQQIRLAEGSDQVEIVNKVDWQTRERALKAEIPLATGSPTATYDLQVGAVVRGNMNEKKYQVPQHQWLDVTNPEGTYGAAILNDCKFGSDKPDDNTIRLTLIYTPGTRGGYDDQATQDFGKHDFTFAIAPHQGTWQAAEVPWEAKRLNQPLRAFLVPSHPGPLGKQFSLVSTNTPQVEIQALKKAEDSNDVVVRLRELDGSVAKGVQIKFASPVVSAELVNGQEQPLGTAKVVGGRIVTDVPAFSLQAFRVKLKENRQNEANLVLSPIPQNGSFLREGVGGGRPVALPFDTAVTSTKEEPGNGEFANHHAIAAEELPSTLDVDNVHFAFGPTTSGAPNAVTARGQTITLPAGFDKVYLLAAADGDVPATFNVGSDSHDVTIQNWGGYIGQWDNRTWSVDPGPNFTTYGDTMNGLIPGYVKPAEVAWFASHNHIPQGNTYYEYSYLFKNGFDIPAGATTLTLPNDPRIKVMAVTVAKNGHDYAVPAAPLYDTLADHVGGGAPSITPTSGTFNDATAVTVTPPLYWHAGSIHYTLDGSNPNASSPVYDGPIMISDPATVKVAQVDTSGKVGEIVSAELDVHDTTPPSVVSASVANVLGTAKVVFSEPVQKQSAEDPSHYSLSSGVAVTSAKLAMDGRSVELGLATALPQGQPQKITINGVKDLAATPNIASTTVDAVERGAVFVSPTADPGSERTYRGLKGLPVDPEAPFTLNLFCKADKDPEDLTLIGGFGRSIDGQNGTGRYFSKFTEGINFWICNADVLANKPLDIGKWQMLTATFDGRTVRLYKNGELVAQEDRKLSKDVPQVRIKPLDAWDRKRQFPGQVRDLTVWDVDLPPAAVKRLWENDKH